jgi:hypothetical protein
MGQLESEMCVLMVIMVLGANIQGVKNNGRRKG